MFAGLVPNRPQHRFGTSVIYARFSDAVRACDRDQAATVPPNFQYIWHPGGRTGRDAEVVGVHSMWRS